VLLFDEVEKAHPDVFNVLLQILDDGRLTDNKGRVVDFSNTLIILTSNVGSRRILSMSQANNMKNANGVVVNVKTASGVVEDRGAEYAEMRTAVKSELGNKFRPEFLNRLDEIIVFDTLRPQEITEVASLMLKDFIRQCRESDIELSTTQQVSEALAETGYSAAYGARPLRRAMQRMCEDAVAEALLGGFVNANEKLTIDHFDGKVVLTNQRGEKQTHAPTAGQGIEEDSAPEMPGDSMNDLMSSLKPATAL
jgi:ATP-dependent Clp protease ATP-binding subunit ClpC